MTLPDPYTVRPASVDDLDAMVAVANAYDLADFGRPDTAPEHLAEDLGGPAASAWLVLDGKGHAAGFSIAGLEGRVLEAFGRVHPDHTGRGIGGALAEATEARAAEMAAERRGDLVLHNSITSTDAPARRLLDERGYTLVRFFWHMERGLRRADLKVPAGPDGVVVRPARTEDDLRAARAVLDESFSGHWMFEPEPFDEWRAHLNGMAGATLLAMDADEVVGAVTSMPISHAGWIEELGVREACRGRGVGGLLLRHAFARLAEAGAREVRLNVDADNGTGATRLYERVGMRVRREWVVYEKRVAAADRAALTPPDGQEAG